LATKGNRAADPRCCRAAFQARRGSRAIGSDFCHNGRFSWSNFDLPQTFALPELRLIFYGRRIENQRLAVTVHFDGDRIAGAADDAPHDAVAHSHKLRYRLAGDFQNLVARF
jgi:hypothetical protein